MESGMAYLAWTLTAPASFIVILLWRAGVISF
jgi:hypothetical protein